MIACCLAMLLTSQSFTVVEDIKSTDSYKCYADVVDDSVSTNEMQSIITIGADLTVEQKQLVMEFFNAENSGITELIITNDDERKYLEGIVDESIIGTHTLSCAFVKPTIDGGIQVKTANLTWVTDSMIANALVTAGIESCQVVATAPFKVSGTGALTGIMKAYEESTGTELEESKKKSATEELVISAELSDVNEDDDAVLGMLNSLKEQAVSGELSDDVVDTITKTASDYGVIVPDDVLTKIKSWLETLETLTYDIEKFTSAVNSLNESLKGLSTTVSEQTTEAKGFFARIIQAIKNFFASLFGKAKDTVETVEDSDFFNQFNTDVFDFDSTIGDSSND